MADEQKPSLQVIVLVSWIPPRLLPCWLGLWAPLSPGECNGDRSQLAPVFMLGSEAARRAPTLFWWKFQNTDC